jgi:hypothetical protein
LCSTLAALRYASSSALQHFSTLRQAHAFGFASGLPGSACQEVVSEKLKAKPKMLKC